MTAIFKIGTKSQVKIKRKPGHAQKSDDYAKWLAQYGAKPTKKKTVKPFIPYNPARPPEIRPDGITSHIKSVGDGVGSAVIPAQIKYEGDLAVREKAALKEIAYKKTCVAPICNKSNYIYVTEGMDPTTLGRKL